MRCVYCAQFMRCVARRKFAMSRSCVAYVALHAQCDFTLMMPHIGWLTAIAFYLCSIKVCSMVVEEGESRPNKGLLAGGEREREKWRGEREVKRKGVVVVIYEGRKRSETKRSGGCNILLTRTYYLIMVYNYTYCISTHDKSLFPVLR